MKNLANMISYALIILVSVFTSLSLCSCSEDYSDMERVSPTPPPTPTPTPTPDPDNTWRWSAIVDQTVNFDTMTEIVEANNIAQLSKQSGEVKLDSATLRYQFGCQVTTPTRVVVMSPDTTAYAGKGKDIKTYGDFVRTGNDSLRTVTTVVEGGFRTQYYTVSLTTDRKEGFSLHAGKWLAYKNVTETSQMTSVWHEPLKEIELNDSIFNREIVHNVLTITLKGNGQTWYVKREKVVIVDHFIKIKEEEEEKEPEHNHPSWWGEPIKIIGQGTYVYKPGVGANGQGQFFKNINVLFENVLVCVTTKSYVKENYSPMDFDWDNAIVYSIGSTLRGKTITSKNVTDLNSVIWRDGKWEAAFCQYDKKNFSWTYMSPDGHDQGMTEHLAETCGLKNFAGKHTARLHPSLFYTATLSEGTLTIKDDNGVSFKTIH